MNELIDVKKIWEQFVKKTRTAIGTLALMAISFFVGMSYQNKVIVEDCKFSNVFRDGSDSYNCVARAR